MIPRPKPLLAIVFIAALGAQSQPQARSTPSPGTPRFEDYQIVETFQGSPTPPILSTAEQRMFRTRIRNGVSTGAGVWNGTWQNPERSSRPNFAGHYFVIRWGCGSQCVMMAIVDAHTGKVHGPPLNGAGSELYVSMDPMSDPQIDFRRNSSLMILRNACKGARSECGIYYFNWKDDRFVLLKRTLIDLTGGEFK